MCIQNLVLIGLLVFKILSKNQILTSIKAVTLLQICRNSNSSKLSCMSSIPARMKKIQLKMKVLDCSQDFSHYKSMGIFSDAQGQLTRQSLVRSGRISNSSDILWMSSLLASMKKIQSKMKALEWTQHFPHYNCMVAMETSGRIWPNFELIQALIHVLITCKYEKNPIKNSGENVMTSFSPLKVYGDFSRRSRAANSAVLSPIWPNFELV